MTTLCHRLSGALKSPVKLWAVLSVATVAVILWLGIWLSAGHGDRQEARRWKNGGNAVESNTFREYLNHGPVASARQGEGRAPVPVDAGGDQKTAAVDWTKPHIEVYSVPNIRPPHPRATLRDLGDQGQAHAIDFLEQVSTSGPRSWEDLRKALSDDDEPGERDPFLFDRVLVATVTRGADWQPGDRMVWTRVFVQPINFKFAAYTVAATDNETIKISSVEATNTRKLSADLALTIPGLEGPKASLGPSNEHTVKTTTDISAQYERLGVDIMPEFLRIIRESESGGDVLGNTKVALSVMTDPLMIRKRPPGEKSAPPDDLNIVLVVTDIHLDDEPFDKKSGPSITVLPQVPLPHCALRAKVWALYEQRHIDRGQEYYDESRHAVVFKRDVDEKRVIEIMGADDVSPTVWKIQIVPPGQTATVDRPDRTLIKGRIKDGTARDLVFSDYGRASKLAHWIRTHPGVELSNLTLNYTRENADNGDSVVTVKHLTDDCAEGADHRQSEFDPAVNPRAG
jgi:hypothetical protein